ncbi:hypothetical protein CCHOA_11175 [Corynebacterium choanae]|uniref:Uncharacterized protein n=1 Tax=Corynebacterium choanae TaxID=1862358 RepID=A0A3G6J919_9CORY|nr:hypothetical protein CCHOA_11175 [Corynebacterium choanae]
MIGRYFMGVREDRCAFKSTTDRSSHTLEPIGNSICNVSSILPALLALVAMPRAVLGGQESVACCE